MTDNITQPCIRKNKDGIDVNYGTLVLAELEGIQFLVEDWKLDQIHIPYTRVALADVPEFLVTHALDVRYTDRADLIAHVLKKEDIRPLGKALSAKVNCWVGARVGSRWLMTWFKGGVANEFRDIDQFYSGMTNQDIEAARF